MVRVDANEFAEKWARRTKSATEDLKRGVEKVSTAPSQGAVRKKDKMRMNLIASIDDGTWEKALSAYSLEDWKKDMLTKTLQRVAGGVDASKQNVVEVAQKLIAFQSALQQKIDSMPDLTLEDSIARSNAWIRGMAEFKL